MSTQQPTPPPTVPARVRFFAYWTAWALGVTAGAIQTVAIALDETPRFLLIVTAVLLFLTAQASALAGVNVRDPETITLAAPEGTQVTTATVIPLDD